MSPAGSVLCDRCGQAISRLSDAAVFTTYDPDGRCSAMGVCHRPCVAGLRLELERGGSRDRESTVVDEPAEAFLDEATARSFRATARSHTASTTRVLSKVERLARNGIADRFCPTPGISR